MSLSNRSVSNSPTPSILLKARRFGIFSIFTVTAIIANPLLAKAQIAVDGSTATEVKGNAIAPVDKGTINGGNLYHSFDKFNVPNSGVIFNTGNSSVDGTKVNNIINRVTGDTPSSILGTIETRSAFPNANLYLLNPNGVVFGANARLDIGGSFNVTTGTSLGFDQNQKFSVDKNSLSFPSGDPKNIQFAIAQPAAIINQGNLAVDAGKNISLTAGTVINTGNLTATNGNVNLAAVSGNSQVELRSPDAVLGFEVNKDVIPSNWNGAIATLPKLAELLTGKASQANQVVVKPDGTIALVANPSNSEIAVKDGMNITSGKIDVSSSTGRGGNVGIFGNQVGLVNSLIDASGINGGGTVLIGGDFQGKGIAPNALQTYVDASSKILTNGLLVGDGGKVIVWSDRSTQFFGAIAAKGGEISGDGGFVEVSGKQNLDYRGSTNALAPHGKIGTLLLDPTDITIVDSVGNASLTDVSAFPNTPSAALLSNLTINAATANVLLQATNNIVFNANINITAAGVGLTAQAGNSIISDGFGNGTITTSGGNVSLIANASTFATGTGNITLGGNITTNGGNINLTINNAGRLLIESTAQLKSGTGNITLESKTTTGTNSGISINGNVVVDATPSTGSILIDASSTSLDAVSFGANAQVISNAGSITINGVSATANGIRSVDGVRIQSATGAIALTGISNGGTGDGVVLQGGNTIVISNNGSNINISGNAANSANSGLNLTGTALTINSGTGNLTFTSDRSKFSTTTGFGFGGAGALTLQPFSSTASLTIDSTNVGNLFLDSSFTNALAFSTNFTNLIIGNASSNSAISIINSLNINSNIAPIAILTARTLDVNGNDIITNGRNLTLTANQGITNLGNITTAGGNVNISSATGNISATTSTNINTSSTDTSGGNISITANNGSLSLQNLDSRTTFTTDGSAAGNITLTVGGSNNISVANVIANRTAINNGNAGNLSFVMGTGNITLTDNNIDLSATGGKGGSVTFPNPVILSGTPLINSFSVNTRGTTSSGNVIFEDTLTSPSPTGSRLSVLTSSGNITFNSTVGLSTAPLAQFLLDSDNTITFANTVFASNITSNQGLTVINGNIVATGTFVPSLISLGNFTLNGDISLVGDEINLIGTGTSTALGNITLKPFTTSQAIAIGGTGDTGTGTLDLLATDISKFSGGASLTIGHESGTGAITFAGATTFAEPTTVRSPVGAGNVTINNNITATGNLNVQAGDFIAITSNAQITSLNPLSVILNSDRDANNSGNISIDSGSLINTNGGDIVLGGGINPLTTPAVFTSVSVGGVRINGTIDAAGGNITLNGSNVNNSSGSNIGVDISGGQVLTNGTGNITITGTGGTGVTSNIGIFVNSPTSTIRVENGSLNLNGTGQGSGSGNHGVFINLGNIDATGTGNITFTGAAPTGSFGINLSNASIKPSNTSGDLSLIANEIIATGTNSISGTGNLFIEPTTSSRNIIVGGASNASDTNLEINDTLLASLQSGFSQVFIGRSDSSGLISLGNNIVFNNPVTLRSPLTTGAINTSGFNLNNSGGSLTLLANQNITTGNINASGNATSLTSTSGAINTSSGTIDTSSDGNGGNISFSSSIGSTVGSLNTASKVTGNAGAIAFSNGNITLAGSSIDVSSNNGNAQNLTFGFPVTLSSPNLTINTVSTSGTNGAVTFSNVVNGSTAGVNNLTINSGSGSIAFNNSVGSSTTPLGAIFVNSTDTTRFNSTVNAASLTTNAVGNTELNGNVTTTGSQTYNDQVILQNAIQLSTTNSPIAFNDLVNGVRNLTVSTGTGNIAFGSSVGNLQPLQDLVITSTGTTTFTNPVIANTITSNTGTTVINGNLTARAANGNGISLGNFTVNGNISLIGDELNLLGTGSGTGRLSISPFTLGQAIAIGGAGETNNTTFDFTATDIAALSGGTLSSLTIGDSLSTSAITLAGDVNFAQPTTIQSPVGTGAINTSSFKLANTGGSLTLLANQNISTGNITAAGNAIALTSTNGAINTSLGDIDAGGGNITFVARNNITTSGVLSRAANGGTISLTSQTGTINTSAGDITTTTTNGRGTGGNITLTANGNVTTKGVSATGDNGKIAIASTTGGIDTTTGASSLASIGTNNSITLTAQQNIVTRDIFASGNQTSLSITSSAGLINTSLGTLDTSSTATNGIGGSITLSSTGTTIGNLNTSSSSGNAGEIDFSNGNITIAGSDINTSSVSGTAANLNFAFPVILNTSTLTINTASTSGTSGNVTFTGDLNGTTANTNNLVINAEGGALNFNGAIGNNIALGNITLTTSGTTTFNSVNASDLKTINGGTVLLLGNVTSKGNQEYNGAVFFAPNITLNSSSGNGNITFNGAIANNVSGTPSNLTLNAGSGNIEINKGAGSSGDRFGNITVTNAGNFSTGSGVSIFANSFTQLAGTGRTNFGGNDNFTGDLTATTDNFSVDEGATLIARNVTVNALNGFSSAPASRLEITGSNSEGFFSGSININADSNSDGTGTFLNRGTITDSGLGGSVTVRAASLDIRGSINAKNISLIPSVNAQTIAIGSSAVGTFRLEDAAIAFLNASSLVSISANNGNVNIGSTQAFNTGASLEIGTTASPANIITSTTGSTLTVDKNLSATGTAIALGNTTVGGNLAVRGDTITLGNTTVGNGSTGNLTIRIKKEVSQTGTVTVGGQTNFVIDTNPLTNLLLADFANNFGSAISLSFINLTTTSFNNLEFRTVSNGAQFNVAPQQINNLKLILDNGTIALPSIPLTGSLTLSAQDVSINGNITATSASLTSLNGGNVTISSNLTTTGGDLAIANSGTFRLNPNANLDLKGNLLLSGAGTTAIGGNITRSSDINFVQPVSLIGNSNIISTGNITFDNSVNGAFSAGSTGNFSNITSNGNITFNGTVDGKFALNLDSNGNFAIFNAAIGGTTPLDSLAIASNTTLTSRSTFATTAITFNPIQISTTGNISVGAISNLGTDVTLESLTGSITTSAIDTANTSGQGGNVQLTSRTGQISTGNITTTGQTGGEIFIDASQSINVGILNSSGSTRAGDVTLDPVGDVVVRAIDASSSTQGGNVTLVSTGGNLRITDTLLSSTTSSCVGASICTSGGTGGNISLQTGGLNPFLVDDATLNGSKGVLTTGATTVNLGTSIPVILSSSFIQGGIRVTPGGIIMPTPTPTPTSTDSKQPFVTPDTPDNVSTTIPSDNQKSLGNADILKKQAGRYLEQGNLAKAFDLLERSYGSELEIFVGHPLNLSSTTIDESQDVLAKVAQQTGDVAALIYPVLLDNRIEIMVVPPKDKGKPFRQFSVVPNQEVVESILTDYRNNIRDVGSNDYLEQSQKLYDLIMRPIDSQLKAMKINTLVFVMDAGLRVVPPAAMHDGKQFVVERYGIASVASMRVTRIEERDRKSTRVLAMGLTDSVSGFSALPSVDVEIKTIASNVLEGTAFLNKDFTVSNLQAQRQLGKYTILHLGTHGKFVSENSGESFIQFWDSRLSLSQIPKLRFDKPAIDMLTLSACQTAVGNNLGISGLAVESGARSVLASLWEVSDAGTAPLMISFYKFFPNAVNKAQAMQQAQISLLSGKVKIHNGQINGIVGFPDIKLPTGDSEIDLSHPFYWSSFILVGNWL